MVETDSCRISCGRIAGDDTFRQQALFRTVDELETKQRRADDSPLERLLVQRVVLGDLPVHCAETVVVQSAETTLSIVRFLEDRLSRAQRQFLDATKSLRAAKPHNRNVPEPERVPSATPVNRLAGPGAQYPCNESCRGVRS